MAYRHVGNGASVFPLQRMGFEVWPVDTVHLSNQARSISVAAAALPREQEPMYVADILEDIVEDPRMVSDP